MARNAIVVLAIALAVPRLGWAWQESDPNARKRQLWDEAFTQRRRQARPAGVTATRPAEDLADSLVGITVWRLRPARPADEAQGATLFRVGAEELAAERVEVGAPLQPGDRVRIGIESARPGYLYLIDREQFADGSVGDAYVIFPRTRIRGGDNRLVPGRLVEVPDLEDTPPFFTLKASRPDQVGELITVILAPRPIPDLPALRGPVKLDSERVSGWEKAWAAPTERIELAGGGGAPYSRAEREAGGVGTRLLTQEEPVPQTMYRVEGKAGQPMIVSVPLGIAPKARR